MLPKVRIRIPQPTSHRTPGAGAAMPQKSAVRRVFGMEDRSGNFSTMSPGCWTSCGFGRRPEVALLAADMCSKIDEIVAPLSGHLEKIVERRGWADVQSMLLHPRGGSGESPGLPWMNCSRKRTTWLSRGRRSSRR
jgi:hypothetical protein